MKIPAISSIAIAAPAERDSGEQHVLWQSMALHILPGVFILALFVMIAPWALRIGLPPLVPVLVSALLGLGFQLWHLLRAGQQRNGKSSLKGIVLYQESTPLWQYFALAIPIVILAFIINGLVSPVGAALLELLPWLPEWFEVRDPTSLAQYPREVLLATFIFYIAINGIAAPIIEELYFRGYLMPRLSRFGRLTPFLATALFTLYHFWQPYYWLAQFLSILPMVYAVWWKRNIKLGIVIHALLNLIGGLLTMVFVLG